jgi:hypothetical protein
VRIVKPSTLSKLKLRFHEARAFSRVSFKRIERVKMNATVCLTEDMMKGKGV